MYRPFFNFSRRIILAALILFLNSIQETMEAMEKHARPSKRVKTPTDAPRPRPPKVYARTSFFSFHRVLFRYYSQDRNAGVQLRLPVMRRIGPAVDNAATSRGVGAPRVPPSSFPHRLVVVVILSCPFFSTREALYPRQRSFPTTRPLHDACL